MRTWIWLWLWPAALISAERQPLSPGDLWVWRAAREARIAASGHAVVYVEEWNDRASGGACSNLWLATANGRERRALTEGCRHDRAPEWSPDGTRIAYLAAGAIHVMRAEGQQDVAVTREDQGATAVAWSPDGQWLAFTARVAVPAVPKWAPAGVTPQLTLGDGRAVAVFVVPASGGAVRQVSTPELSFTGRPAWMPDGRSLIAAAEGGPLFSIRVADGVTKQLTRNNLINGEPLPSPDGARIAWIAWSTTPQSYRVKHLWVMNPDGTRDRMLAGTLDRDPEAPAWSSDSRTVYFLADDRGATHVYAARNDGTVRQLTDRPERLRGFSLADNGRAVTVRSSGTEGGDVVSFAVDLPGGVTTLASPNEHFLAERDLGAVDEIRFESAGNQVQAWLVKPPHFDKGRKYPLLIDIADAPRRMLGWEFSLRAQIFASQGYVVLRANPRGAPGYGEQFGNLLPARYPGDDADDLIRGVEFAVKQGYIDEKRVFVAGGLVAAWLLGHSDRFAGIVARHPVVDWVTDVATAPDGARRAQEWMHALPWEDPDQYVKRSPIFAAANFKTPALVIAGARDVESDELFFALQMRKVDSALVRIGAEGPAARVLELETVLGWLKRYSAADERR